MRWFSEDHRFMSDVAAAESWGRDPLAHVLLMAVALFFLAALIWAAIAELEEVAVGPGKVIPSTQVQVVQSLEGGILSEVLIHEGDRVNQGQVLLRIDDTQFSSSFREGRQQVATLRAQVERLRAEAEGRDFVPSDALRALDATLAQRELDLFNSRQLELKNNTRILDDQLTQKRQELEEMRAMTRQLERRLELVRKEIQLSRMSGTGKSLAEADYLRLKREMVELEGSLENARLSLPRQEAAVREQERKRLEPEHAFRAQAQAELNTHQAELARQEESLPALEDRLDRTLLRSPVNGTVIRLHPRSLGQVIRSGMNLVEILPLEDKLLVEARLRPQDIAFIHSGQMATVKLTAYDYSIYGGLPGQLEHLSADTITDERGDTYYLAHVRTHRNTIGPQELPIIPGMVASVEIITGRKTVLDYLLKPLFKAREHALRER
ncbi:MAG: HlyD family type I secretion periplasmic adaptor subunit [Magnetococcus sp. WYHC-3]